MKKFPLFVLSATALLASVSPGLAQQQPPPRPERPYRGLFGGGVGDSEQLLTLNFSLGGGYDDNVLANGPSGSGAADPRQARGGGFGSVGGELSYTLNRTRVGLHASAATSGRYFPDMEEEFLASHSGSVGASFQLAKSTRVTASHTSSYQPFLTLGLFPQIFEVPGQAIPPRQDLGVDRTDYFTHASGLDLTQGVSRRGSLSFNYRYQLSDFRTADRDFTSQTVGGRFTLGLARGLGMRIGYGYTDALYDTLGQGSIQGHNVDAGIDFDRALSFSRRTTLSFGTGSAVIVDRERTWYRLTGNARLNREIGRTWNASIAYARTAGFVESLAAPVFQDVVTLAYGGMINRRLQFTSSAAASIGEFALTTEGSGFDSYTGTIGLTFGLTRHLGLSTNYSYYRYSFDAGAPLPSGFSREMDRHSVQAQLSVWLPLVHRARRPDASR